MAIEKVMEKPVAMRDTITHYCPGCTHGVIHRLVAEVLDELGLREKTVGVAPVGCSVLAYNYFNCDFLEAAHGRAPAFATGMKRIRPDLTVFAYQGDGDLASIGTNEIIHAANRGEKITVIFVNNAIYGMTGGQMAPTTLPDQVTTTSPFGRNVDDVGWPIRVREMIGSLRTPAYIARGSSHSPQWIIRTKQYIKKAFQYQSEGRCFSLVEVLSNCNTNWGMTPRESMEWIATNMIPYFPLGELKTPEEADVPTQKMVKVEE